MSLCLLFVGVLCAGCGKKGPPLAPYVRIPAAVEQLTARRSGNDVYVSVTVPATNIDTSVPVSISRLEVYGYTGRTPPPRPQWAELGTLIATIPVVPPPPPASTTKPAGGSNSTPAPGDSRGITPPVAEVPADAADAGTVVTIVDPLTEDKLVQGPIPAALARAMTKAVPAAVATPLPPAPLRRFYAAFAFSPRGRNGPLGATAELALLPTPDPPNELRATYTETEMTLNWEPSGGVLGYLLDHTEIGPEPPPLDDYDDRVASSPERSDLIPPGPTSYNVYRVLEADLLAPLPARPLSTWNAPAPAPLNASPIPALTMTDAVQFERRVCYVVRAVRGTGPQAVESAPTEPYCLTPVDVFPPPPPRSLASVPAGDSINLIWESSDAADVAGYLVLRGKAGDATLQTLTPVPIADTRYRDASITAGGTYVYAVVAVDGRLPAPNVSVESNRVEETAR